MGKKVFITITGTNHYLGDEFLEKGTRVTLIKDPDNKYDHEAIRVEMEDWARSATSPTVPIPSWARASAPAGCTTRLATRRWPG